jgi:hypothetical protein
VEEWRLVDGGGGELPILCPGFHDDAAWCGGGARAGGSNLAASQTRLPSPL